MLSAGSIQSPQLLQLSGIGAGDLLRQHGIDVVCDGELYRFDVNHPETNGMIEYFVRPMQGVRYAMPFDEVMAYRALPGMRFRTRPPGVPAGNFF